MQIHAADAPHARFGSIDRGRFLPEEAPDETPDETLAALQGFFAG